MTIEEDMLRWLHNNGTPEAAKVMGFKQVDDYEVGCGEGTCVFEVIAVHIYYLDAEGYDGYDVYEGELSEFIRELTDAPPGPE